MTRLLGLGTFLAFIFLKIILFQAMAILPTSVHLAMGIKVAKIFVR